MGHTIGVGPNGRGKTVLLGLIAAALEPVMGNDGIRLVIDKDASNKLLIEACGGVHRSIRRNEASGLAPLVALAPGQPEITGLPARALCLPDPA